MDSLLDAARWYLVLLVLTWAAAPWVRLLFPRMPSLAAGVTRPVALLATVYPSWLLASLDLINYSDAGLWITVAVLALSGWPVAWRLGLINGEWLRALLVAEVLSLLTFAVYVGFRGFSPMILNTEKPMETAFLASLIRTEQMPPPDPWFAGEPINYYYLGFLIHGSVARLAVVPVGTAFNLALATTFSMTAVVAAFTGFGLARPWLSKRRAAVAGVAATVLTVWAGNLYSVQRFLDDPRGTVDEWWWTGIGWDASRVVHDEMPNGEVVETINEFPSFSFVLGDLHPHVMALPYTMAAVALAMNALSLLRPRLSLAGTIPCPSPDAVAGASSEPAVEPGSAPNLSSGFWLRIAVTGALVGSLYVLNSWDLPTFGLVIALALWFGGNHLAIGSRLGSVVLLAAGAVLAWAPFYLAFDPPVGGDTSDLPDWLRNVPGAEWIFSTVAAYHGERTSVGEFLTVFGVPFVIAIVFLAAAAFTPENRRAARFSPRDTLIILAALVVVSLILAAPVALICGALVLFCLDLIRAEGRPTLRTVAAGFFAVAFVLIFVTEFFYLRDVFESRMNTLFKVYYQVWTLLGFGSALALLSLWRDLPTIAPAARPLARPALFAASLIALLCVSVYPIVGSTAYTEVYSDREWQTLDGTAFLDERWADDRAAVQWLSDHADSDDVVLEAAGCGYGQSNGLPSNVASVFSGVPTIIGWDNSERQWRNGQPALLDQIVPRQREVAAMYADPASPLLDQYGVTYIYIGYWEQTETDCDVAGPYDIPPQEAFAAAGWEPVFTRGDITIYHRAES